MEELYSQSIQGNCSICKCQLDKGGYIYLNSQSTIIKLLCSACRDFEDITKVKNGRLIVRKLSGLFNWKRGWYEIILARNLIIKSKIISEKELIKLLNKSYIEIIIK